MGTSLAIAATLIAGICVGNIPEKIEYHLNEDLRFCVFKTSEEYNKCISESSFLFVKMYHRYKSCFEQVDEWSSGGYSDGTWAQFKFKVRFRGMYYSSTTTQLKKIPDEEFAERIKQALKERKYQ